MAVITGSRSGPGRAIAKGIADVGVRVALVDINGDMVNVASVDYGSNFVFHTPDPEKLLANIEQAKEFIRLEKISEQQPGFIASGMEANFSMVKQWLGNTVIRSLP